MADYVSDRADTTPPQADVGAQETPSVAQHDAAPRPAEPAVSPPPEAPATNTAESRAFVARRLTRHNAKAAASAVAAVGALLPALAAAALPGGFTPVSEIAGLASWEVRNGRLILRLANGTVREFAAGEWVAGTEPGEVGIRSDLVAVQTGGGQAAGGAGNLGLGAAILGIAAAGGLAAAAAGGGGGGGGAAPQPAPAPAPTFDVVRSGGTVSFAGTATGDIVATVSGGSATFTRGGISRTVDGLFGTTGTPATPGTTMSIAGGQTVVLVVTDTNGQQTGARTGTVSAVGAGNLVIRATDAGPGALTNATLNVDVRMSGGTLTFDMTNDNQDRITLTGTIDLGGGALIVSDGTVNVTTVTLANIGSLTLNSEFIVTLAQFVLLRGSYSGRGTLTIDPTDTEVNSPTALNNVADGAIRSISLSVVEFRTLFGNPPEAAKLNKLASTATVRLTDTSLDATALRAIDEAVIGTVNAVAAESITGPVADVKAVIGSAGVVTSTSYAATLTGSVSVADANSVSVADANIVDADTTGVVTAKITERDATTLARLTGTGNAYTIVVEDPATAAELNTINAATEVQVNASGVATITGTYAEFATLLAARNASPSEITLRANFDAVVPGPERVSVANANVLNAATSGRVTATILETDLGASPDHMGPLHDLTPAGAGEPGNAYTITVLTPLSVNAAALNRLDAKTTVEVDAKAVRTLTGSAEEIAKAISADGIKTALDVGVTIDDGVATASDLNTIDQYTSAWVDASAVTVVRGEIEVVLFALDARGLNFRPDVEVRVTDTAIDAAALRALDRKTNGLVNVEHDGSAPTTSVTGSYADVNAVLKSGQIAWDNVPSIDVTVTDVALASAINEIKALQPIGNPTIGVVTATVAAATASVLVDNTPNLTPDDLVTLTVLDAATAEHLKTLDGRTGVAINVSGVTSISGPLADINSVYDGSFVGLGDKALEVTGGAVTVEQANALADRTSGVVTATVSATDATAAELLTLAGNLARLVGSITNLTLTSDLGADLIDDLLGTKTADGSVAVAAADMSAAQLSAIDTAKVKANGITGTFTINADVAAAQIKALLGKTAADASLTVDATGMSAPQIAEVAAGISVVDTLTGLTLTSAQNATQITALLGKTADDSVAVDATGMVAAQLDAVYGGRAKVPANGITGAMSLSTTDLTETEIGGLLSDVSAAATVTVAATDMTAAELTALSTNITKVDTITGLTVTNTQSAAEIGNLLGKASGATVDAASMDAAKLGQVAANISGVGSITKLTLTSHLGADLIDDLLGTKTADGSVDVAAADMPAAQLSAIDTAKVKANGITGTFTINADVAAAQIKALLGKTAADASLTVDATGMSAPQIAEVAAGISVVDTLTGLTLTSAQNATQITALLGKTADDSVAVDATGMVAAQLEAVYDRLAKVPANGITGAMSLSRTGLTETVIGGLLSDVSAAATVTVAATDMTAAELTALSTNITKVDTITGLTVTNTQSAAEIGNLLGKASGATVDAASMDAAKLGQVAANISGVGSITNLTLTIPTDGANTARTQQFAGLTDVQVNALLGKVSGPVTITGNVGADWLDLSAFQTLGVSFTINAGAAANPTADTGNDRIYAGFGTDTINTYGGDDYIEVRGGSGPDNVNAGSGDDTIAVRSLQATRGSTYDGGTGVNRLLVYGTNDFTGSTVLNLRKLELEPGSPSQVIMTISQARALREIEGNVGNSELVIVADPVAVRVFDGKTLAADGNADTLAFTFNGADYTATVGANTDVTNVNALQGIVNGATATMGGNRLGSGKVVVSFEVNNNNLVLTAANALTDGTATTLTGVSYTPTTGSPATVTPIAQTTDIDLTLATFATLEKLTLHSGLTARLTVDQLVEIGEVSSGNYALTVDLDGEKLTGDVDITDPKLADGSQTIHITQLNGHTLTLSQEQAAAARVDGASTNKGTVRIVVTGATLDDAGLGLSDDAASSGLNDTIESIHNKVVVVVNPANGVLDITQNTPLAGVAGYEIPAGKTLLISGVEAGDREFSGLGTIRMIGPQDYVLAKFGDGLRFEVPFVADYYKVVLTAQQATGRTITGNGRLELGGQADAAYDFRQIADSLQATLIFGTTAILNAQTAERWGSIDNVQVEGAHTLTLTAAQATNKNIAGIGQGRIKVTLDDIAFNFSQVTVQGGSFTGEVTSNLTLDTNAVLGSMTVDVTGGQTFTLTAAQATGRTIRQGDGIGQGVVKIAGDNSGTRYDFSNIGDGLNTTLTFATTGTLNTNTDLGGSLVIDTIGVAEGATLTLTAAQATGRTITGADATAGGGDKGGSVVITGLVTDTQYNFNDVTAGRASTGANDAGSVTVQIAAGSTIALNANTILGNAVVTVGDGATLTLTAAQAAGRTITGTGTVKVTELEDMLVADLSKISAGITLEVQLSETDTKEVRADLSTADKLTLTSSNPNTPLNVTLTGRLDNDLDITTDKDTTLTLSAAKAHKDALGAIAGRGKIVITDLDDMPDADLTKHGSAEVLATLRFAGFASLSPPYTLEFLTNTPLGSTNPYIMSNGALPFQQVLPVLTHSLSLLSFSVRMDGDDLVITSPSASVEFVAGEVRDGLDPIGGRGPTVLLTAERTVYVPPNTIDVGLNAADGQTLELTANLNTAHGTPKLKVSGTGHVDATGATLDNATIEFTGNASLTLKVAQASGRTISGDGSVIVQAGEGGDYRSITADLDLRDVTETQQSVVQLPTVAASQMLTVSDALANGRSITGVGLTKVVGNIADDDLSQIATDLDIREATGRPASLPTLTAGQDLFLTQAQADQLTFSGGGRVEITASAGAQTLRGTEGNDVIWGDQDASSTDTVDISQGGTDRLRFFSTANGMTVTGFTTGTATGRDVLDFSSIAGLNNTDVGVDLVAQVAGTNTNRLSARVVALTPLTSVADAATLVDKFDDDLDPNGPNDTTLNDLVAANSKMIFLTGVDQESNVGANTNIWLWHDTAAGGGSGNGNVDANELTLLGTLIGVSTTALAEVNHNVAYNPNGL